MKYFVPNICGDKDVEMHVARWLSKAGGAIPLEKIQRHMQERFKYPGLIFNKKMAQRMSQRDRTFFDKAYKIEDGKVSRTGK